MADPKFSMTPPSSFSMAFGEDQKVTVAGGAQRLAVAIRVLVDNVVANPHMHGSRDRMSICRGQDADLLVWEIAACRASSHIFTQSERKFRRFANCVIQATGFAPKAEFAAADVTRHAFRGGADARQFVIVNRPRAIHGDMRKCSRAR